MANGLFAFPTLASRDLRRRRVIARGGGAARRLQIAGMVWTAPGKLQ
jgi:hypothetical protein